MDIKGNSLGWAMWLLLPVAVHLHLCCTDDDVDEEMMLECNAPDTTHDRLAMEDTWHDVWPVFAMNLLLLWF